MPFLLNMKGQTAERWWTLCEQAAMERDPVKLLELATEINRLLEEKEQRLKGIKPETVDGQAVRKSGPPDSRTS